MRMVTYIGIPSLVIPLSFFLLVKRKKIKNKIINHFQICSLMINVIINAKKRLVEMGEKS